MKASEKPAKQEVRPLPVRHADRPMGRPFGTHLVVADDAVTCRECGAVEPIPEGKDVVGIVHRADCPVFAEKVA